MTDATEKRWTEELAQWLLANGLLALDRENCDATLAMIASKALELARAELDAMRNENTDLRAVIANDCENETLVENFCRPILGDAFVDGDSNCVPGIVGCVEEMVKRFDAMRAERDALMAVLADAWVDYDTSPFQMATKEHEEMRFGTLSIGDEQHTLYEMTPKAVAALLAIGPERTG